MRTMAWLVPLVAVALGFGACGGPSDSERFSLRTPGTDDMITRELDGSEKPRIGKPTKAEVRVIRAWASALSAGDIDQAADLFALHVQVADGINPQRGLHTRGSIVAFNRSLACGQKLVDWQRGRQSAVIATFELTDRRGAAGECGKNVGQKTATAFVVERRLIQQYLSFSTALRSGR
jgi:hypothetical protein